MHFKNILVICLGFLLLNSCDSPEQEIKIVVSTDVHGAFFPIDPITGKQLNGSMAHVSQYISELRKDNQVVLLDNGDIIQGDPSVYYFNFEDTSSTHIITKSFDLLNYDAGTVGNHDIEAGHSVYDRINSELNTPWLAANCISTKTGEPYFEPYAIVNRGPVKIAVLGLITPRIPDWLPENIWSGMEFQDMVEAAKHWIPIIQKTEKPDLIIGLFHAGLDYTYNNQDGNTPKNENAVRLVAEQVAGFDILFAGHDHKTWNEYRIDPEGDSVLILGSQSKARELAQADVLLQKKGRKWSIVKIEGHNISMSGIKPDQQFTIAFESEIKAINEYVNQDVAELKTALSSRDAFFGPSAFMSLIHQVQLGISKADISFAAPLSYSSWLKPGMLKMNDLFDLYRFENLLYTMSLSGKEILDYLNFSYSNWFSQMKSSNDHLIKFTEGNDGSLRTATAYYNFDSALGLDYVVDVSKEAGEMVTITGLSNGDKFDLSKRYEVAINSYRGNGGGGHLTRGAGIPEKELSKRLVKSTDKDLRFYMKVWMEKQKEIEVETIKNWTVIPEKMVRSGKDRDYKILFKN